MFNAIRDCLFGNDNNTLTWATDVKADDERNAAEIIDFLYTTDRKGKELRDALNSKMNSKMNACGLREELAKALFKAMDIAVREARDLTPLLKDAKDKIYETIKEIGDFAEDHPIFCSLIVLGFLVLLMPWVLEAVGFAELGPIEGSLAAQWQRTHLGMVPKGSLFSFFQRLGMVWHLKVASV